MAGSSPAMTKVDAAGAQSPLDTPAPRFVNRASGHTSGGRAHSSAGERSLHTGEVQGSIPCAPTIGSGTPTTYQIDSGRLQLGKLGAQGFCSDHDAVTLYPANAPLHFSLNFM